MEETESPTVEHLSLEPGLHHVTSIANDHPEVTSVVDEEDNDTDHAAIVHIKAKKVSKIPTKIRNVIKANQHPATPPDNKEEPQSRYSIDKVSSTPSSSSPTPSSSPRLTHNSSKKTQQSDDKTRNSTSATLTAASSSQAVSPPTPTPTPSIPSFDASQPLYPLAFNQIQAFIDAFQYNYTGVMFYKLRKTGGSRHILDIFRQITTFALPIQCVEAVFLGSVLTASWRNVDRIPISFKSKFKSSVHRHIILAVHENGKWGALGISRRSCLMYKAMEYDSLWDLVQDYKVSYQSVYHKLLSVYCGNPMPHNFEVDKPIVWKAIKLRAELNESTANKETLLSFLRQNLKQHR